MRPFAVIVSPKNRRVLGALDKARAFRDSSVGNPGDQMHAGRDFLADSRGWNFACPVDDDFKVVRRRSFNFDPPHAKQSFNPVPIRGFSIDGNCRLGSQRADLQVQAHRPGD